MENVIQCLFSIYFKRSFKSAINNRDGVTRHPHGSMLGEKKTAFKSSPVLPLEHLSPARHRKFGLMRFCLITLINRCPPFSCPSMRPADESRKEDTGLLSWRLFTFHSMLTQLQVFFFPNRKHRHASRHAYNLHTTPQVACTHTKRGRGGRVKSGKITFKFSHRLKVQERREDTTT